MARPLNKLSALSVKNSAPGKYSDGGGLWLFKGEDGTGSWVLRVTIHGRRREMGLGSIAEVSLKEAREAAEKARALARQSVDPITDRKRKKREAAKNLHLLKDIANDAFESRKGELKGDGEAGRWFSPLRLHVLPKLGKIPASEIDQTDIRDALAPIWHSKAETASKALGRLAICMRHAAALGLDVDLQVTEKARALLGAQRHTTENIPAMPWAEVPAFYATLDGGTVTHLALRLLILTGVRSASLRYMREEHVKGNVWTIPATLMKGRKGKTEEFKVPLSSRALEVIQAARQHARDGFLFPSTKKGVISDMTMGKHMERAGLPYRPHGFRSSLRDWMTDEDDTPYDVAELTLAHKVGGKVELSYKRSEMMKKRRAVLERWAEFVCSAAYSSELTGETN